MFFASNQFILMFSRLQLLKIKYLVKFIHEIFILSLLRRKVWRKLLNCKSCFSILCMLFIFPCHFSTFNTSFAILRSSFKLWKGDIVKDIRWILFTNYIFPLIDKAFYFFTYRYVIFSQSRIFFFLRNGGKVGSHHLRVDLCSAKKYYDCKNTVFIGNVPFNAKEDELIDHFSIVNFK